MAVDKALISGSTAMLLLKLLSEKDMYGYEMIDTLKLRSNDIFELKAGTLYPLLHSLEEKRCLASYEKEVLGKTRKYYRITKTGRKFLKGKEDAWKDYAQAVEQVLGGTSYAAG
ncbi:lineage-specific thermal regulator protein [uncultured Roseburia sp.]|uniref:PadR family transcriptional regulator n=1 Tax=Brotonthovivens ammoniilytica TaxID=2981725 RepID=A0ABT2TM91_9FIRM|nr:PadR family transcriptional regulator [Brotonthovivens ammoniilytica]MCU6763212.1 PadR family transcriptional regulator [Brotonthovivens ammoniilytica]SCJ06949.1 lineage-specific thermal regulator protein [uncultured Roseburia sp.]